MSVLYDPRALEAARSWLGTPHVAGASRKRVGCDCVGLIRGVFAEVEGRPAPAVPPLHRDWFAARGRPLVDALRRHLREIAVPDAGPGTVVVVRIGGRREVHCGVLDHGRRLIHSVERHGVVRVPAEQYLATARFAAAFSTAREETT